uniref:Peptidase S1 domain-containing protein n=1 Tax=Trichuris muris TaxID=70415 RepID=A0A5S6QL27_TRIMR
MGLRSNAHKALCDRHLHECGIPYFPPRSELFMHRIVGGSEARPHSFPWQVQLRLYYTKYMYHTCGGSIIESSTGQKNGSDLVLTAAHCLYDHGTWSPPEALTVVAGVHNIANPTEPGQRRVKVKRYQIGSYNKYTLENDIALLLLRAVVDYSNYIVPICLPENGEALPRHVPCFVAGWGADSEYGKASRLLKQVETPVLPQSMCWQKSLPEKTFCAGFMRGKKDACLGDSGSPLVCKIGTKHVQYGIVSFGHGCAKKDYPGVYTRVSHYVQFIRKAEAKLRED